MSIADRELLRRRAARYARRLSAEPEEIADFVVFARARAHYAIALTSLREIRPLRRLTRVPGASRVVPGVTHVRGEILSVHDLEAFMAEAPAGGAAPWALIAEHGDDRIALLADDVSRVEAVPLHEIRPLPVTLGHKAQAFQGVIGGGVLLLNVPGLFALPAFFRAF